MPYRVLALLVALTATARADGAGANGDRLDVEAKRPQVSTQRRVGAVLAAIGPGFIVRGAGSWLVHERRTAKRLATSAAVGLGAGLVGGLPVGLSGANPYTVILVPLLVGGVGAFLGSWWADIAVAAGADRAGRPLAAPPWSVELGTLWVHDPYRERGLGRLAGRLELGRIGLGAATLLDAGNDARDAELEVRVRVFGNGETTGAPIRDGTRVFVRTAGRIHRDDADRVTTSTAEIEVVGRLDLAHIDSMLAGSFGQVSTGIGVERVGYAGIHDVNDVLLGTFAWGLYLGSRGEATVFYDHRRDSLAGGIAAWRAAGFLGSFGGSADVLVAPRWAVRAQIEWGNAWVSTLAVRYQGGKR